jgi:hypothetical protein
MPNAEKTAATGKKEVRDEMRPVAAAVRVASPTATSGLRKARTALAQSAVSDGPTNHWRNGLPPDKI